MRRRLIRILSNERGQTLLVLTFLILLVIGALATREVMINAFIRTVSQNTIEDKLGKQMAQSGLQEAIDIVSRLDDVMDTNGDGFVDSKDGPYTSDARKVDGGEYNFRVTGHYANERVVYFRFDDMGNPNWTNLTVSLTEDAGSNPLPIGQFAYTAPQFTPLDWEYRVSMYPGDNSYFVDPVLQTTGGTAGQTLWVRVRKGDNPEPFSVTAPQAGSDAQVTFPVYDPNDPNSAIHQSIDAQVDSTEVAGSRAFEDDSFEIEASGVAGDQRHNIDVFIRREDLLKYAFFSNSNLVFLSGATVNGFVYAGTDLLLNGGDPLIRSTFRKPVKVLGSVRETPDPDPATCGTFSVWPPPLPDDPSNCLGDYKRGIAFAGSAITLPPRSSMDEKQAIAADPSEKGGWYIPGPAGATINLDLFDFDPTDGTADPAYDRGGPNEHFLPGKFNGLVFVDGPVTLLGGTLRGKSITIYSRVDITIMNSVYTGTTPITREPVNLGLVAGGFVYIDTATPRVLHVHAAIYAAYPPDPNGIPGSTWAALLDSANPRDSHPPILNATTPGTDRGTTANPPDGIIGGCDISGNPEASPALYSCNNVGLLEKGVYDLDDDGTIESATFTQLDGSKGNGFGWDETQVAYRSEHTPQRSDAVLFLADSRADHHRPYGHRRHLVLAGQHTAAHGVRRRSPRSERPAHRRPDPQLPVPIQTSRATRRLTSRFHSTPRGLWLTRKPRGTSASCPQLPYRLRHRESAGLGPPPGGIVPDDPAVLQLSGRGRPLFPGRAAPGNQRPASDAPGAYGSHRSAAKSGAGSGAVLHAG